MKIYVDNECVYEAGEHEQNVLLDDITRTKLRDEVKRRVRWVIAHKVEQCEKRLIDRWFSTLQERYDTLPSKSHQLVKLIKEQTDYLPKTNFDVDNQSDENRFK